MPKVICHDKDGNEKEFNSDQLLHRPSIYGILIEDGKILLSKQYDGYDFPGGGIHLHETVDEALVREFWEETGLNVKPGKLIHIDTSFFINYGEPFNCTIIYKVVEKISGELSKDNLDSDEIEYVDMPEWILLDDVKKIKYHNSVDSPMVIKKSLEQV